MFLHPGVPKIIHTIQYMHFLIKGDQNWSLGFEPLVAVSASACQNPTIPTVRKWISDTVHPKSKFGRSYWGLPNSRHALCSWWSTCKTLQTQPRANEVHTWHLCQVSLVEERKNKHIRIWCACKLEYRCIKMYIYIYTNLNHKHIFFSIAYLNMVESKKQIYND